jgi:heme oxygenase
MELMTSWERKGREEGKQEGRQEGKEELVVRLIHRRFGDVSSQVMERLNHLSSEQLNELGVALFDFQTPADLDIWLSRYTPQ